MFFTKQGQNRIINNDGVIWKSQRETSKRALISLEAHFGHFWKLEKMFELRDDDQPTVAEVCLMQETLPNDTHN